MRDATIVKIRPNSYDAIIAAAFHTFGENPGASLQEVADFAGVGRATLYRHFATREALMLALAQIAGQELDAAVEAASSDAPSYLAGLKQALEAMIPLADRQWFLALEPVQNHPEIAAINQRGMQQLHYAINAARREGVFDDTFSTEWIAEVYDGLIYAAWTLIRRGQATHTQASSMAWTTFLNGTKRG